MEPSPLEKADLVQILLVILLFLTLMGLFFVPHWGIDYQVSTLLFGALFFFYGGIKKMFRAQKHQQQFYWYKQAFILYGVLLLLVLLYLLQEKFIGPNVPDASAIHFMSAFVLLPAACICLFAEAFFLFRGLMQRRQQPERMETDVPLRQTARSRPQPKEAREDE
jgi:uncharacterized membrane protein HdeD (DUF308 family)